MDREKVIKGLNDIGGFIAGRIGIEQARNFLQTIDDALAMLKEYEAVEPEMEGGGSNWWMVCGECHGQIDEKDDYCRHCGRRILRNEKRK